MWLQSDTKYALLEKGQPTQKVDYKRHFLLIENVFIFFFAKNTQKLVPIGTKHE